MRIGLVLPHFSDECTWERLIEFAPEIERLGFNGVWARDHISFESGVFDPPGRRFIDPFVTLATIAGMTSNLHLGFAVVVPLRHPVVTLQLAGSLDWVSRGRMEFGIGIGGPPRQFGAVGIDYADRIALCEETLEVMQRAARGGPISYSGRLTNVTDVLIDPAPRTQTPIWYGGHSKPALRRTVRYCTGIMPSRTTFRAIDVAATELAALTADSDKRISIGSAPLMSLGRNREDALDAIAHQLPNLTAAAKLDPGDVSTDYRELDGALIVGNAAQCAAQLAQFADHGIESVVLDLRLRMSDFEDIVRAVAEQTLPALR
jgi:alkanesulfonate monooxygenase SsuD/methylene tetrahydromethanopterin reductase-like flavin-dependent oxidoreductase (luciferase family)